MKNIISVILLIFINFKSDPYSLCISTKNVESKYLKVQIKNNSKKTLIFYNGNFQSDFKIIDEIGMENIGETTTINSGEDYLDYQFDYSKSLIDKTMKKYSISFQEAIIYLHYKKKYVLILPKMTKDIDLPVISRNYTTRYKLDSTKSYFLSVATKFPIEYIPKYVKDSLNSKNIEIITPKINSDKININIHKFFRRYKNFYMK